MGSVQLGSALSLPLISTAGPAGTSWLRLSVGALVFLALARPPLRAIRPRDVPALTGLGVATGLQTITFLAAIARIPLGTAVAVEFLVGTQIEVDARTEQVGQFIHCGPWQVGEHRGAQQSV